MLCLKVASRGDLLLAGPAFRELRSRRPAAHLTLLVGDSCTDVARHLPFFDEILTIDDRALFAGEWPQRVRVALDILSAMRPRTQWRDRRRSKREPFTETIIFHRDWRYGFLARVAGIPVRRGFQTSRGSHFLTHYYVVGEREHEVSQYLGTAGFAPCPMPLGGVWRFAEGERDHALATAADHGFDSDLGGWTALGFGGGRNVKNRTALKAWPIAHYRELASRLVECGRRVVWLGDAADAELLDTIGVEGVVLAGKLTVPETAAVLSACTFTVANDTLLLHLAEALETPTLGLFGPTSPARYGPLAVGSGYLWQGSELPCSPCSRDGYIPPCMFQHQCMGEMSVDSVLSHVYRLFSLSSEEHSPVAMDGMSS